MNEQEYIDIIQFRKKEYNYSGYNELVITAKDLMELTEDPYNPAMPEAIRWCMLEGDRLLCEEDSENYSAVYYCDNLSNERRKMF